MATARRALCDQGDDSVAHRTAAVYRYQRCDDGGVIRFFSVLGAVLLYLFVTSLGIHIGIHYIAGRTATLVSLGTVFFLCVGVAICMVIMVSFRGAFHTAVGSVSGDDSRRWCCVVCCFGKSQSIVSDFCVIVSVAVVTFYAITQFLLQRDHSFVLLAILAGYGFTMAAMFVPVISEFEVSLDRDRGPGGESS